MSKRTFQPKKKKAQRKFGFRKRMSSAGGRAVIKAQLLSLRNQYLLSKIKN
jgi:large subunit ribosomal protein L34